MLIKYILLLICLEKNLVYAQTRNEKSTVEETEQEELSLFDLFNDDNLKPQSNSRTGKGDSYGVDAGGECQMSTVVGKVWTNEKCGCCYTHKWPEDFDYCKLCRKLDVISWRKIAAVISICAVILFIIIIVIAQCKSNTYVPYTMTGYRYFAFSSEVEYISAVRKALQRYLRLGDSKIAKRDLFSKEEVTRMLYSIWYLDNTKCHNLADEKPSKDRSRQEILKDMTNCIIDMDPKLLDLKDKQTETDWFDSQPVYIKKLLKNKIHTQEESMTEYVNRYHKAHPHKVVRVKNAKYWIKKVCWIIYNIVGFLFTWPYWFVVSIEWIVKKIKTQFDDPVPEDENYTEIADVEEESYKCVVTGDQRPSLKRNRALEPVTVCVAIRHDGPAWSSSLKDTINYLVAETESLTFVPDKLFQTLSSSFHNMDLEKYDSSALMNKVANMTQMNLPEDIWNTISVAVGFTYVHLYAEKVRTKDVDAQIKACSTIIQFKENQINTRHKFRNAWNMFGCTTRWTKHWLDCLGKYAKIIFALVLIVVSMIISYTIFSYGADLWREWHDRANTQIVGGYKANMIPGHVYGEDPVHVKTSNKPKKQHRWLSKGLEDNDKNNMHMSDAYFGHEDNGLCYFNINNNKNKIASFEQRVLLSNITEDYNPDWKTIDEISNELADRLVEYMDYTVDVRDVEVMESFISTRPNYNETEKSRIIQQFRATQGTTWREMLNANTTRFTSFIKDEPYFSPNRPRPIQGASSFVKTYYGAVFHAIGEAFFAQEFATKKIPIRDRAKFITDKFSGFAYFAQTDHSAMESNATPDLQEHTEMIVYKKLMPEFEHFEWFMEDKIIKLGIHNSDPMIQMEASRMSGAPNTSLGNSIVNYVCLELIRRHFNFTMDYVLEGDDALIGTMEPMDPDAIRSYARTQGFDLKFEPRGNINEAGYLSMTWELDTMDIQSYDFADALMRATIIEPKLTQRFTYWQILAAKMLSLAANNPSNPFAYKLAEGAFRRASCGVLLKSYWTVETLKNLSIEFEIDKDAIKIKGLPSESEFMHPQYYDKHLNSHGVNNTFANTIYKELTEGNKDDYMQAIGYIIDIYKENKPEYTDTRELVVTNHSN